MELNGIIAEIDREIATLLQIKSLLGAEGPRVLRRSGGRKRTLSAEARERIAAAQRKRWAKQKRARKGA
jgi:hypothetical protein